MAKTSLKLEIINTGDIETKQERATINYKGPKSEKDDLQILQKLTGKDMNELVGLAIKALLDSNREAIDNYKNKIK